MLKVNQQTLDKQVQRDRENQIVHLDESPPDLFLKIVNFERLPHKLQLHFWDQIVLDFSKFYQIAIAIDN